MHRSLRLRRAVSAESPSVLLFAFLLSLLAAAPPARAVEPDATPPPEPTVRETEAGASQPIVVTATRIETPLDQLGSSVSVVTADDIERHQDQLVIDALERLPGVSIRRSAETPSLGTNMILVVCSTSLPPAPIDSRVVYWLTLPSGTKIGVSARR